MHAAEQGMRYAQMMQGNSNAKIVQEKTTDSASGTSSTKKATIGSTTISTEQAEIIKKEVRDTIAKTFPRIHMSSVSTVQPNPSQRMVTTGSGNIEAEVLIFTRD